jgi:large subunit ribosomal protein L13
MIYRLAVPAHHLIAPTNLMRGPVNIAENLRHQSLQVVGRVATVISTVLQGKDRPDYNPTADGGDVVVVINADNAILTGRKEEDKIYYSHSGKPGNLKKSTPAEKREQFGGAEIIWKAVNGMLPKNKLRKVLHS